MRVRGRVQKSPSLSRIHGRLSTFVGGTVIAKLSPYGLESHCGCSGMAGGGLEVHLQLSSVCRRQCSWRQLSSRIVHLLSRNCACYTEFHFVENSRGIRRVESINSTLHRIQGSNFPRSCFMAMILEDAEGGGKGPSRRKPKIRWSWLEVTTPLSIRHSHLFAPGISQTDTLGDSANRIDRNSRIEQM